MMNKTTKQILASILFFIASVWLSAYVIHLLPDHLSEAWYGFAVVMTVITFCVASFVAGLCFPFKEKP